MASGTRTFTFGPGSLESIQVRIWKARNKYGNHDRIKGTVSGFYTVYCGAGWSHVVYINEPVDGWLTPYNDETGLLVVRAYNSDADAAETLAHEATNWALEDWFDPCDDPSSEPDAAALGILA